MTINCPVINHLHLLQLRENPGRKNPSVPQPQSSGSKVSRGNVTSDSTTPFHSTTSTGFFSLEDANNSKTLSVFSSSSEKSLPKDDIKALHESNQAVMERLKRNEQPTPSCDYDDPQPQAPGRGSSLQSGLQVPQRHRHCSSAGSSTSGNVMAGTRKDLLQGIRAMDDSIQNLKDEMNKLMSVYETVKLKPDGSSEKPPLITEMGQSVLEVVGEDSLIRFKDFGSSHTEGETEADSVKTTETGENDYNTELGVYHENEISGNIFNYFKDFNISMF